MFADAAEASKSEDRLTDFQYDANGRLDQQDVDNKDQNGDAFPAPAPATFITEFTYDRLGRLTERVVDPDDIGSEANCKYDWQGGVTTEFDTSGRGVVRTFEGRGLVATETPLQENTDPGHPDDPGPAVTTLATRFIYDAMGRRTETRFESQAAREKTTTEYDDLGRVWKTHRVPGTDGGDTYTTIYEYDTANNVTRTVLTDGSETWSDATALYDEGGFNYESRQRLGAGVDGKNDPVTQRKFDWAGNVTEERGLAAATPDDAKDRIISTHYDGANRVDYVTDSLGGRTDFARDDRGNITEQTVKLNNTDNTDNAVTSSEYDGLSRAIHVTSPADSAGGRPDAMRAFDSRGNLIRETLRDAADAAKMSTFFFYDAAGRQVRKVILATAMPHDLPVLPDEIFEDMDRVTEFSYDADGRLIHRVTYNNDSPLGLTTTTCYDALGRVYSVTDPSDSYFIDDYSYIPPPGLTVDGRLHKRTVSDGAGAREFLFTFDGHDRVKEQTAVGTGGDPNLTTAFQHDPLDRQSYVTDPRGIVRRTRYWMTGWLGDTTEDWSGAQERFTEFEYNKLGQLTTQTAKNKAGDGTALADQVTRYRYDSLGRMVRAVYPDSVADPNDPNCTDCVKTVYDVGGRMTSRTDQRGLQTVFTYDKRSLLLARTTGADKDTFDYDALGRLRLAKRGTTVNDDEVSSSVMAYNGLGDLDYEDQAIAEGTVRRTDYDYDQAGNRKSLAYPGGTAVGYTPTELNQVATITLNGGPLVAYTYAGGGHPLANRRVTTVEPGGSTHYDHAVAYNTFRQIKTITNSFTSSVKATQTVAAYTFTRDGNGNPLTQTAEGDPKFAVDDRVFSVDRLNRLTGTDYAETGKSETAVLDSQGNRESHVGRDGATRSYTLANGANEYATIDPDGSGGGPAASVSYDAAGNLSVDEAGRQYEYDEQNRLVRVTASDDTVMAEYSYDALGRRVWSSILVRAGSPPVVTRYYYDGSRMIEERDGSDARRRYHVNGGQYIDEHVETYEDGAGRAGEAIYYLSNLDYSVAGTGNADGSVIERLDYTSSGDFVEGGTAPCVRGDVSGDGRIDGRDVQTFVSVLLGQDTNEVHICAADIDVSGGVNLTDVPLLVECLLAGGCPAEVECTRADVNDDGHVDGRDAQPFVNVLLGLDTNAVHTCAADIDDVDGVNLADVPLFVQCLLAGGCGGGPPLCRRGDVNNDGLVTIADVAPFVTVLLSGTGSTQQVCAVDVDGNDIRDGRDIQPFVDCLLNAATCPPDPPGFAGVLPDGAAERKIVPLTPGVADEPALQPRSNRAGPDSGTFAMHGCPIDVLSDGLILQYNRARYYDVKNGRWLQRDRKGYVDGANLYHAFGGNAMRNSDPAGEQFYEPSDAEVLRWAGMSEPDVQAILAAEREASAKIARGFGKTVSAPFVFAYGVAKTHFQDWWLECKLRCGGYRDLDVYRMPDALPFEGQFNQAAATTNAARLAGSSVPDAYALGFVDLLGNFVPFQNGILNLAEGKDRYGNIVDPAEQIGSLGGEMVLVYAAAKVAGALDAPALAERPSAVILRVEEAGGRAVSGISAAPLTGEQLLFPFAERAPTGARGGVVIVAGVGPAPQGGLIPGMAGSFVKLDQLSFVGDQLALHHMPQAALGFTPRGTGGAIALPQAEHVLTRTFGYRGAILAREEAGLPFRTVLARDIRDLRSIAGTRYNPGIQDLLDYYRLNFPWLMAKPDVP